MSQKLKVQCRLYQNSNLFSSYDFSELTNIEKINISHERWPPDKNLDIKINILLYRLLPPTALLIRFVLLDVLPSSFRHIRLLHHFFSTFIHSQYESYASIYFGSRWIFVFFLLLILELFSLTFLLHLMHSSCTHTQRKKWENHESLKKQM
jgi:hypothetical protein